jgi:hypothetical protein
MAWSLLGLAVPVVLFYLIRQRLRVKKVSTLLFWDNLAPKVHNLPLWRKLRRVLSLLLQLLILVFLIFALVRPVLPGQATAAASFIIVLDPSVTMTAHEGSSTRWAAAVATAERKVNAMGFGDEAAIVLAGDPPHIVSPWSGRRGDLFRAIEEVQPAASITDIRPALKLAQNLALSHPGAAVEIVSDTVWPVMPDKDLLGSARLERIGNAQPNSGITLFSARHLPSAAGEYQLVIRLEQNTEAPASGELTVRRNGQLMDVVPVTISPGKPWQKIWHEQGAEAFDFTAEWKPQGGDALAADQQAAAHLDAVREIKIVLVSPPNRFLEVALGSQSLVKMQRFWPAPPSGEPADLTIFNGTVPPEGWKGAAVLINPPQSGFWGERVGPIDKPLVSGTDKNAAVMRFTDMSEVQLRSATEFKPAPGATVYVDSFGKPLIYGHWEAEPRWIVLAFDLDQSDLVFRTAFPILWANLLQGLRPEKALTGAGNVPGSVATLLKPMASSSSEPVVAVTNSPGHIWNALPFWWWFACAAFLLLLLEWSLYTRRITE